MNRARNDKSYTRTLFRTWDHDSRTKRRIGTNKTTAHNEQQNTRIASRTQHAYERAITAVRQQETDASSSPPTRQHARAPEPTSARKRGERTHTHTHAAYNATERDTARLVQAPKSHERNGKKAQYDTTRYRLSRATRIDANNGRGTKET